MNIRKAFTSTLITATMVAGMASAALAQQVPIGDANPNSVVFNQAGLSVTGSPTEFDSRIGLSTNRPANLTLTAGGLTTFTQTATGEFAQGLAGGTFEVRAVNNNELLLGGTFGPSIITGAIGGQQGGLQLDTGSFVNYNPLSTQLGDFSPFGGGLSITFLSVTPLFASAAGTSLNNFNANDSILFSAVRQPAVPEPGAVAFAASSGLGLLGLMGRARRRSKKAAA